MSRSIKISQRGRSFTLPLLLFIVGASTKYDLSLIGRIPLSEIIAFASLPFLLQGAGLQRYDQRIKKVFGIILLWIAGIVISDFVNRTGIDGFIRGFAKPVFTLMWFGFLVCILQKSPAALMWYPVGQIVAAIQNKVAPRAWTEYMSDLSEYSAAAYSIAPIVVSIFVALGVWMYRRSRLLSAACFFLAGPTLIYFQAPRSAAAIPMGVAGIILLITWIRRGKGRYKIRMTGKRLIVIGLAAVIVVNILFQSYTFTASRGLLGEEQQMKLASQSQTVFGKSMLGLALGGRTEVFAAILAIKDRPIIGFGSWSGIRLGEYYYKAIEYVGTDAAVIQRLSSSGRAPGAGHSTVFMAWMENTILAGIAFFIFGWLTCKGVLNTIQSDSRLTPLFLYIAVGFAWSYFFSPFGLGSRFAIGLFLALYVVGDAYRAQLPAMKDDVSPGPFPYRGR